MAGAAISSISIKAALPIGPHEHNTTIRMLVRPGDYVFPGAPIAVITPAAEGADAAIRDATALGPQRVSSADLEFAVKQFEQQRIPETEDAITSSIATAPKNIVGLSGSAKGIANV